MSMHTLKLPPLFLLEIPPTMSYFMFTTINSIKFIAIKIIEYSSNIHITSKVTKTLKIAK